MQELGGKKKVFRGPKLTKNFVLFKCVENKDRIEQDNKQDAQVSPFLYNNLCNKNSFFIILIVWEAGLVPFLSRAQTDPDLDPHFWDYPINKSVLLVS